MLSIRPINITNNQVNKYRTSVQSNSRLPQQARTNFSTPLPAEHANNILKFMPYSQISFLGETNKTQLQAQKFLDYAGKDFTNDKKNFIIVTHMVENSIPFVDALSKYGKIAGIIAKPNSKEAATMNTLRNKGYHFIDVSREDLKDSKIIKTKIFPLLPKDEKTIIFDTGGYFTNALDTLNSLKNVSIVEDTENGLQKYEKKLKQKPNIKIPTSTVARSQIKTYEDLLIGRSITKSVFEILKRNNIDYKDKKISVIGFGKVGRGAAYTLRHEFKKDINVCDYNFISETSAKDKGFHTMSKEEILKNSDIIISATGDGAINDSDLKIIKPGCIIASCTSSDDEFNFKTTNILSGKRVGDRLTQVGDKVFVNNGNAANFAIPEFNNKMLEPYIYLTHSGLIACAADLDKGLIEDSKINILNRKKGNNLIENLPNYIKVKNANTEFIKEFKQVSDISKIIDEKVLNITFNFVENQLKSNKSGHDIEHIKRVYQNASKLLKDYPEADDFTVKMCALLHDIDDYKVNPNGHLIKGFLENLAFGQKRIYKILDTIRQSSFSASGSNPRFDTIEKKLLSDADKLDAVGATGICRAIMFGNDNNSPLFNSKIFPKEGFTKAEYKDKTRLENTTINHFFDKLLNLENAMQTDAGKKEAKDRTAFMIDFLHQFFKEQNLTDWATYLDNYLKKIKV